MSLTLARLCGEWRLVERIIFKIGKLFYWKAVQINWKAVEEGFLEIRNRWRRFSRISRILESRWRKSNFERENWILGEDFRKGYSGRNIIIRRQLCPDNVSSSKNIFEQTKLHLITITSFNFNFSLSFLRGHPVSNDHPCTRQIFPSNSSCAICK